MGKTPCCNAEDLKKGAWTADEDKKLITYIQEHGEGGWRTLPQKAGLQRCGKSCRLRWANYLRPDIKRGDFSSEEEQKIIELHATLGNRWSGIARHLPRRTDNEIKNHWNTYLKKRLISKGIDPASHNPIPSTTINKDSNNVIPNPSPKYLSRPSSALAHLLNNKSTPKLASSQCLDPYALKSAQNHQSISMGSAKGDKDVADHVSVSNMGSPSRISASPVENPLKIQRLVSSSARLLNKMASSINGLKSILSKSVEYGASDGTTAGITLNVFDSNSYMLCPTSTSTSTSTSSEVLHEMGTNNHATLEHPFDIDHLLLEWQGVSVDSSLEGDDIVRASDGGVLSSGNIESYMCPPNFIMKDGSTISACESSESLEFLGRNRDKEALARYDDKHEMSFGSFERDHTSTEDDDHFMEVSKKFVLGESSWDHLISDFTSRDSHNGGGSDGGVLDANYWSEDFNFENIDD